VSPPRRLQDLNYIFFYAEPNYPGSGFGVGLVALVAALNTDLAWIREHTRLMERATEWDEGHRPAGRLLSGSDISEAKAWAARRPKGAPEPTALHLEFIRASEGEEASRTSAERKRLDEMAAALKEREEAVKVAQEETLARQREAQARARMRSFLSWGAAAVVLGLIGFTGYAYYLKGEAEQQRKEAQDNLHEAKLTQSRALVESARQAADLGDASTALLLALEALPDRAERSERPLVWTAKERLSTSLNEVREIAAFEGKAWLSADGWFVLVAHNDGSALLWSTTTRRELCTLSGRGPITRAEFSPDGTVILTEFGGANLRFGQQAASDLVH